MPNSPARRRADYACTTKNIKEPIFILGSRLPADMLAGSQRSDITTSAPLPETGFLPLDADFNQPIICTTPFTMKRIGFLLKVKANRLEEYKKHHEAVWPEMLAALSETGWHNYSLFMREDGLLFGYFETPDDFQTALDGMAKKEINAKWQSFMAPYFESPDGAHPDKMMVELEEIFHLD